MYEEAKETFFVEELVYPNSYITDEIIDDENFDPANYAWQLATPIGLYITEITEYYDTLAIENEEFEILNDSYDYIFGNYEGNITFAEHPTIVGSYEIWVHIREITE